jgi:hypothetical protein
MKKLFRLLLIILVTSPFLLSAQSVLLIHNRKNPVKTKRLELDRLYVIKTVDTLYSTRIVDYTDSTIRITKAVKTKDSAIHITRYPNPNANDTSYYRLWRNDTVSISFKDIISLEKDVLKNRRWLEPFGYLAVGGVLGLVLIPISAVAYGPEDAVNVAVPVLSILAVTLPVIYFGTRKTKYDMQKEWTFK